MVSPKAYYKLYLEFPPLLKEVLAHRELSDINIALSKQYKLSDDQQRKMVRLEASLVAQEFTPEQLQTQIQNELHTDTDHAKNLTREILSRIMLPMEWYLGDIQSTIKNLGGDPVAALAEAQKNFPEVYAPQPEPNAAAAAATADSIEPSVAFDEDAHPLLRDFDTKAATLRGKADILLRLTGLSSQVEAAMKSGELLQPDGERLMQDLDAVSYAVNTQDLNPFELNALKRKIRRILKQTDQLPA